MTPASAHAHDHDHDRVVLSVGHVDALDVHYHHGELGLLVHDETVSPAVTRDPHDVLLHVKAGSQTTVPANPAFSFLGGAGDPVWILPQQQDPALLWPGWATEELTAGTFEGDAVDIHLLDVHGPGDFWLYTTDGFGAPTVLLDSTGALPDTMSVPVGVHAHGNWAFGAEGDYELTLEVTATPSGGSPISSGPVDYDFTVGELEGHTPPFSDVGPSHPFAHEIGWLVDAGIAQGFPDSTFRPAAPVTRQAMAAFLHRLDHMDHDGEHHHDHGHAAEHGEHGDDPHCHDAPFTDVPADHPFCGEIDWLVDAGIAQGFPDGTFRPAAPVTRQAMAAFLYRLDHMDSGLTLTITGLAHHYHTNDTVTLTAVLSDDSDLDHYHWFVACPDHDHDHDHDHGHGVQQVRHGGSSDFVVIPGEGDAVYSFTATSEVDGCMYKVVAYGTGHSVLATSAPVTVVIDHH